MSKRVLQSETSMVRRILRHYRAASPAVRAAGDSWYDTAWSIAGDIYPERPDIAVGVLAALSPRCQWKTNVAWARTIIAAARRGDTEIPTVHTETMRAIAWSIATGALTPEQALNGPKTSRFAKNIAGDRNAVTCDVWACRAAEGAHVWRNAKGEMIAPNGRRYAAIERAYQRAAKIAKTTPAAMQAVVWVQVRGEAA